MTFWQTLLVDTAIPLEQIQKAVSEAFRVDVHEVAVCDSNLIDKYIPLPTKKVLCFVDTVKGDFPTKIEFFVEQEVLDNNSVPRLLLESKICGNLRSNALVGGFTNNPYDWLLLSSEGKCYQVEINDELYDQDEPLFCVKKRLQEIKIQCPED